MIKAQPDLSNITRFEYGNTRAWWVRFEVARAPIRKMFSDGRYGGTERALAAAVKFRDQYRSSLPLAPASWEIHAPDSGRVFRERRSYRNALGDLVYYDAWSARIRVALGKDRATSYSIAQWGEKGAKRLAERWLQKQRELQRQVHPAFANAGKTNAATRRRNEARRPTQTVARFG